MENARDNIKNKITEEDIDEFRQRMVNERNRMAWGASFRGGFLTLKDEVIAEILKEREKEEMGQAEMQKEREKKWIEILDPSNGNSYVIEIFRDRCSSDNFVTAQTVAFYSLETKDVDRKEFSGLAGGGFTCYKQAKIHWKDKDGDMREDFFYVLPRDVDPKEFNGIAGGDLNRYKQAKIHSKGENSKMRVVFSTMLPKDSSIESELLRKKFDLLLSKWNDANSHKTSETVARPWRDKTVYRQADHPPRDEVPYTQAPTDSGYAFIGYTIPSHIHTTIGKGLETVPERTVEHTKERAQAHGVYSTPTVYSRSVTSNLSPRILQDLETFAATLNHKVEHCEAEILERIYKALPDLLRAFALKLGYGERSDTYLEASFFIHRHRMRISNHFRDRIDAEDMASLDTGKSPTGEFAINRYLQNPVDPMIPPTEPAIMPDESIEFYHNPDLEDVEFGDSDGYYKLITDSSAYNWLIGNLRRESILTRATPDDMDTIKQNILRLLPGSHEVSRRKPPNEYKVVFDLEWDPLAFVKDQKYSEIPGKAIGNAIVLTGSENDAQAATTSEYLSQTWPTTGEQVLRLVTDVILNTKDYQATAHMLDGTSLYARINEGRFEVISVGPSDSIAEIGQILAWLGAALRSSQSRDGVTTCTPLIREARSTSDIFPAQLSPSLEVSCNYIISFQVCLPLTGEERTPGQCWHDMFRNPVMVSGYPILTKPESGLGLEMPLGMMAVMTGAERMNEFDGKFFIKGYSTMLIATKMIGNMLVWHYFYNADGERISYFDHTLQDVDGINLSQFDTARHVVGWCSEFSFNVGTSNDDMPDVEETGLPHPHKGCILEKVNLNFSRIIGLGATIAVGTQNTPPYLIRDGYFRTLEWIEGKYFVLWDEQCKRGWLVNGTSALLHLVRADLKHSATRWTGPVESRFLFRQDQLKIWTTSGPYSPIEILTDPDNMRIEIWPDGSERYDEETRETGEGAQPSSLHKVKQKYVCLEHLVRNYYNLLEKIIEFQERSQNGIDMKFRIRKHLEGWDFNALTTNLGAKPRVATLHRYGYGWVDFVRSLQAVTLLGRGFGDIIKPTNTKGLCPKWHKLPEGEYYLAARVKDLKKIMKNHGNRWCNPPQLVQGILWQCPARFIASCPCTSAPTKVGSLDHCDPVQLLVPSTPNEVLRRILHTQACYNPPEDNEGAVIFGHKKGIPLNWGETGGPMEGDPPPPGVVDVNGIEIGQDNVAESSVSSSYLGWRGMLLSTISSLTGHSTPLTPQNAPLESTLVVRQNAESKQRHWQLENPARARRARLRSEQGRSTRSKK